MTSTISLEFKREGATMMAALGTDTVTFLDGRWNAASRTAHIHRKLADLRKMRSHVADLHFVGFTRLGVNAPHSTTEPTVRMADPNPPAWVSP